MSDLREELEKILYWDEKVVKGKDIYIWGTGNTAVLFQEGLRRLEMEENNVIKIVGYCDNNPEKWNKEFYGKPTISPSELYERKNVLILICSPQPDVIKDVKKQVQSMGKEFALLDDIILKSHKKEVMTCYDSLDDEKSKRVLVEVIKSKINGGYVSEEYISSRSYFAVYPFSEMKKDEVFIDCGAFVGDTIEMFMFEKFGNFKTIYAFEPDSVNCKALRKRVKRLAMEWNFGLNQIKVCESAVGNKNGNIIIERSKEQNGLGSRIGTNDAKKGDMVQCVSLDEYIKEKITFLKADIESYEFAMIEGARKHIEVEKPRIAVSIYHNAVDLYSILLQLKSMVPEYKFAIRQHRYTSDTILYAWID